MKFWYFSLQFVLIGYITMAQSSSVSFASAPDHPQLFSEGFVTTGFSERDFALSPNGQELFYTRQAPLGSFQTILYSYKQSNGSWSKPVIAPFAGNYSDLEPSFSPDGKRLYFASNRPVTDTKIKDFDIWYVDKTTNGWGTAKNVGWPVNTPEDEFYPCATNAGHLYFTAAYKTALGKEDIFVARKVGDVWSNPSPLDSAINSALYEFNAYVAPDESFILFTAYGRKDDKGRGDIYVSFKDSSGKWQPAKNLAIFNSDRLDYCPFVSFDRSMLFFTSERHSLDFSYPDTPTTLEKLEQAILSPRNGSGDIYWVKWDKVVEYFENE